MAITNLTIPAGKIYFDAKDAVTGLLTGERYFGDTPGCSMAAETTSLEVYTSDDQLSELAADVPISIKRSFKFKAIDISPENLAIFVVADILTIAQTTAAVTAESLGAVKQDRYYQIGQTANKAGRRGLSLVTVKVGASTKILGTDYTLDLALGRIYIVPGGGIANAAVVLVDYTYATNSRTQLASTVNNTVQFGALRFLASHTLGPNRDFYMPTVALSSDGEAQIKREGKDGKVMELGFQVKVFSPSDGSPQLYIDGRAI